MRKMSSDIEGYFKSFPKEVRFLLEQLREIIKSCAPEAEEVISYGIPTYVLHGNLVHFAAYKNHIGFYPAPSGISKFEKELSIYKMSKGAVQFPLDKPLPLDLVSDIVKFRMKENIEKAALKKTLRTCTNGHKYYKSSDCPTCPICEAERKTNDNFLSLLSAPARRALENQGVLTVAELSKYTEKEILKLHGMGKASIPTLIKVLEDNGLSFRA